jgi:hypothetical protein
MAVFEWLAFSSLWVAAAAGALCAAAGRALGAGQGPGAAVCALAAAGTFAIYSVDRLRDVARDRHTTPRRTAFVERFGGPLRVAIALALAASGALAWQVGARALVVLVPVAALGFFHRRLKRYAWWKPFYVSGAWVAVVVGLPAVALPVPRHLGWVAVILGATILANVVASNLRDDEAVTARFGARVPLRLARGLAASSFLLALLAPAAARPLALVPLATLAVLAPFQPGELYGLIAVDGALLLGAAAACALY